MGLMKRHLKGWKTPRLVCQCDRRVRQKPVQLDLFGVTDFFYHEGRLLYEAQKNESSCVEK